MNNHTVSNPVIISCAANSVSVFVCLLAAILVCALKLFRKVVYRLALYQVLASLALAMVFVMEIIFIDKDPKVYTHLCTAVGWLGVYAEWMKLLFTMWITFHLFCFGVFYKNLKKLEVIYVTTSLTLPAIVAMVPLATNTYGVDSYGGCWIVATNDSNSSVIVTIEIFALWNGPAIAILLVASIAMVVMVIKLAYQVCKRLKYKPIANSDQNWKALKQFLPLAAFPILFFTFFVPPFLFNLNEATHPLANSETLPLVTSVFFSLWSLSSGITLIVHIFLALICTGSRRYHYSNVEKDGIKTVRIEPSAAPAHSATSFPLPTDSLTGDMSCRYDV